MPSRIRSRLAALAASIVAFSACADAPTMTREGEIAQSTIAQQGGVHASSQPPSSVQWNRKAIALFRARGGPAGRVNAYVSLAQYRGVLAAAQTRNGSTSLTLAAAAAGASVVVLEQFYPLDSANIDLALATQRTEAGRDSERQRIFALGEAVGRAVGASVLAQAASDNFGLTSPGTPPVGPGYWFSSGAPIVRGGLGARPFFLTSGSEIRSARPPAFGSPEYLAGLAEVRAISDTRTPQQVALTLKWVPFSGVLFNAIATDLIVRYGRSEVEAARILAYANAAAFDAIIGCFDTKYTYWYIRPTQADPLITLATGLPNHPSYPSAHSCETGAFQGVLESAFPSERAMLADMAQEASISRVLGGIHYRFDGVAGLTLGRTAARLALLRGGLE